MKRILLFFIIVCFISFSSVHAQIISQDSEGESTILFPGGTLSFDIAEAAISFNYNNLNINSSQKEGLLVGLQGSGKNESGVADLFDSGRMAAGGSIAGEIGFFWSKNNFKAYEKFKEKYNKWKALDKDIQANLEKLEIIAGQYKLLLGENPQHFFKENVDINAQVENSKKYLEKEITDLEQKNVALRLEKALLAEDLKNMHKALITDGIDIDLDPSIEPREYFSWHLVYAHFGVNLSSIPFYQVTDSTDMLDYFKKETFCGSFFNIGANLQFKGSWILGFTIGLEKTNNLDALKKKDYKIENYLHTSNTQQVVSEKSISAYDKAQYEEFTSITINGDIIKLIYLKKKITISLNLPYFRWKLPQKTENYKNTLDVGFGVHFTKSGTYLGGFYVEYPDLGNAIDNPGRTKNKLKIGIVGKVAFKSIFSFL